MNHNKNEKKGRKKKGQSGALLNKQKSSLNENMVKSKVELHLWTSGNQGMD